MNYLWILIIPVMGFLDRWGGGGYDNLPAPFNDGWKPARRFVIPAILWLTNPGIQTAMAAVMLGLLFSLNLDEIEDRNWDEIMLWSFVIFFGLTPFAGPWAALPAVWWPLGIWLSNTKFNMPDYEIFGRSEEDKYWSLDWFWVELIRGLFIGAAMAAFRV